MILPSMEMILNSARAPGLNHYNLFPFPHFIRSLILCERFATFFFSEYQLIWISTIFPILMISNIIYVPIYLQVHPIFLPSHGSVCNEFLLEDIKQCRLLISPAIDLTLYCPHVLCTMAMCLGMRITGPTWRLGHFPSFHVYHRDNHGLAS